MRVYFDTYSCNFRRKKYSENHAQINILNPIIFTEIDLARLVHNCTKPIGDTVCNILFLVLHPVSNIKWKQNETEKRDYFKIWKYKSSTISCCFSYFTLAISLGYDFEWLCLNIQHSWFHHFQQISCFIIFLINCLISCLNFIWLMNSAISCLINCFISCLISCLNSCKAISCLIQAYFLSE